MPDSSSVYLPVWNLSDLFASIESPEILTIIAEAQEKAESLRATYEGKLEETAPKELAQILSDYEVLSENLGRIICHADLMFAGNMADAKIAQHSQTMREKLADIEAKLLFVELELASLSEDRYQEALKEPAFYHYQPWLRRLRAAAPYQLEARLEQMLVERSPSGRAAWIRLFDETVTSLKFDFDGTTLSEAEILNLLSSPDAKTRQKAGASLSKIMHENQRLFSLIINVIAKDKEVDDRWRGFNAPVSARNLANDVDDAVVDALAEAVTSRMPDIAHRYYQLKAGWMAGTSKKNATMAWWDRNAPLKGDDDRRYSWDEAKDIVLGAFAAFTPEMAGIAKRFFDEGWIDAGMRDGKASGAFSHPTVPSAHPYILLNYDGKARDVMTLAHELGHGVHQLLAADQGLLMADTPLTLAETASVFAEMLVFRELLARAPSDAARRFLLAGKIEDMLNTVVRQIAFHNFETALHERRRSGELMPDDISAIWMDTQKQALGPAITLDESYQPIWSYIPHFIHTPFYVYAYAFGDCLVNALWQVYETSPASEKQQFIDNYIGLLKAGGTQRYDAALSPFELDAADPAFWHKGLDMISEMIDRLEETSA